MSALTRSIEAVRQRGNASNNDEVENPVDFAKIIDKMDAVLSTTSSKRKSELSGDNIRGIQQLNYLNKHLETIVGKEFRIELFDLLINDKLDLIMSYQGHGNNNVIKALGTMQPNVVSTMVPSIIDRGLGDMRVKKGDKE